MSRTKKTAAWVLSLTLVFGLAAGCSDGDGGG